MGVSGGGSVRVLGAVLILLGGSAAFLSFSHAARREQILLRDLIAALELLASGVRWRGLPLPDGIAELAERKISGPYFVKIGSNLTSNMTLQSSWVLAFSDISGEAGGILRRTELGGDTQQVLGSLRQCVEELSACYGERQGLLRQQKKLCAAGLFSAAGIVIILLA